MMLAQHPSSTLPPSPSFSAWEKEDALPPPSAASSSSSSRPVLGGPSSSTSSSAATSHLRRNKSSAGFHPYDRASTPSHPSSSSGQPTRRRIQSVTNVTGPGGRTRGLRIPSLQAVAHKIEQEAPLLEDQAIPSPAEGPVVYDRGSAFLPLSLPRPNRLASIDVASVEALEGVPYPYVMDRLMLEGPALLQNALAARLSLPPTGSHHQALSPPLPEVLSFDLNMPAYASPSSPFSLPPNYVLAVRPPPSSSSSSGASQAGSLLPIHDLIYRATCAHLPPIPVRSPSLPPSALPVISITLPSPSTLPLLNSFLYIQRPDILLSSLLHLPPLPAHATPRTRAELTTYLAQTMDLRALLERIGVVHQVWGNVCALGCADGLLWKALDAAWEVLVGSVALVQARGPAPIPAPVAVAPSYPSPTVALAPATPAVLA